MPAVLIHGVPETAEVWAPLIASLARKDVVALSLPGFGCPRPAGFGATKDDYAEWLVSKLRDLADDGPLDLVGHDWGAGLVLRAVSMEPRLARSWVVDVGGLADPQWRWHDLARTWQTEGEGEEYFARRLAAGPGPQAKAFREVFGVPADGAAAMANWLDETMAGCILDLYRSAEDIPGDWGSRFADLGDGGLVVIPADDVFSPPELARRVASRTGAVRLVLPGMGHWWMLQDPVRGAREIENFWASRTVTATS